MIKLKAYENVRITYEYELELTNKYIRELNGYLQAKLKPVNAETIPFFDAELLAGIYEEGDHEEAQQVLNKKLEEKGHKPYIDVQVMSREYFTGCENCIYSLYDIVLDILNQDVWDCEYKECDFDTLDHWKDIDRREEN